MLLKKSEINFFKFEYLNIALVKIVTKWEDIIEWKKNTYAIVL